MTMRMAEADLGLISKYQMTLLLRWFQLRCLCDNMGRWGDEDSLSHTLDSKVQGPTWGPPRADKTHGNIFQMKCQTKLSNFHVNEQ